MVNRSSDAEEFACIWQSKRVGIITIETEKMWLHFSKRRFRGCQPSWPFKNSLVKDVTDASVNTCCKLNVFIFGKASLVFGQTLFWNQMRILYQNKVPDCVHFFCAWARQAVIDTKAVVYELTKWTQEKPFAGWAPVQYYKAILGPIRSRHPLEFLEIVRWESIPRGSFART